MNDGDPEQETILTAYHEAGHAVVGYALGGSVQSLQLGGQADEDLPERFGDCRIQWDRPGEGPSWIDWHLQREILTVLAGPTAEMIYNDQPYHPALFGPWQDDWRRAWEAATPVIAQPERRTRFLEATLVDLRRRMSSDHCWAAISAVADELMAHEFLEQDQVSETLEFWLNR